MLSGNLVRLKFHRGKVLPQYVDVDHPHWLGVAEDLLALYRNAIGNTRGEVATEVMELIGDSNAMLVPQGFTKLLDDRCEYEIVAVRPPEDVRETVFRLSAVHRIAMAASGGRFDREHVVKLAAGELGLHPGQIEPLLFADLKDEQRVVKFDDITPEQLLHRYNVALAQAVLLRSVGVEIKVWGESPARIRQLFRAIRFRRLIATIRELPNQAFAIRIDGPLSLFSATQKYGLQLALFLPTLLHCHAFELTASLRWGADRHEKTFELSASDGLRTHAADFGVYIPKEFELFAASFRSTVIDWQLHDDPSPITLADGIWVPDFTLIHTPSGQCIYLEVFGYWRRVDLEKHSKRLQKQLPGQFLIVAGEQFRTDREEGGVLPWVVQYRRTPSAEMVVKAAARLIAKSP